MDRHRHRPRPCVAFRRRFRAGVAIGPVATAGPARQPQDGTERAEFVGARESPVE